MPSPAEAGADERVELRALRSRLAAILWKRARRGRPLSQAAAGEQDDLVNRDVTRRGAWWWPSRLERPHSAQDSHAHVTGSGRGSRAVIAYWTVSAVLLLALVAAALAEAHVDRIYSHGPLSLSAAQS